MDWANPYTAEGSNAKTTFYQAEITGALVHFFPLITVKRTRYKHAIASFASFAWSQEQQKNVE